MKSRFQHPQISRRFLAIYFRVGLCENSYLSGPVLVSTCDYAQFHFWDEPCAAELANDEYEILKLYPRGLTCDEAARQFELDFPARIAEDQPICRLDLGAVCGLVEPHEAACYHIVAA